jgi:hypothetical protein
MVTKRCFYVSAGILSLALATIPPDDAEAQADQAAHLDAGRYWDEYRGRSPVTWLPRCLCWSERDDVSPSEHWH